MTHQECQDRLLEFAYGELDRRRAGEVQAHLEACPACAGVYRRIAGVREVMGRLEPELPPDGGERVVLAAAREAADRRREERRSLGLPLWAWKASVATVLVAAVAGVSVKIVSMRQRSQVEEVGAAPVAAGRAPEAPTPPMPPPASAPAEARAPRPAVAARAAKERAPAAAPGSGRIGFVERGAADAASAEALAEPEPRRRAAAAAPAARPATRQELAAAEPPPAAAGAPADAEAKAGPARAAVRQAAPAPPGQSAAEAAPPEVEAAPSPAPLPGPPPAAISRKDPAVKAAEAVAQRVESRLRQGALAESARPFQACGPDEDAERRIYADASGRVVKYVRQVGSADAALTYEEYYDGEGRLRHVYIHGGAVNGAVVEHRIWLDASGIRLREEQRFRRGRYPFPEVWPDSELRLEAPDASVLRCGAP